MQKHVNLVDLVKSFPTNIYLQNLASIQKRTSLVKLAHLAEKSGKGSISNLSTKERAGEPPPAGDVPRVPQRLQRLRRGARLRALPHPQPRAVSFAPGGRVDWLVAPKNFGRFVFSTASKQIFSMQGAGFAAFSKINTIDTLLHRLKKKNGNWMVHRVSRYVD